MALERLRTEPRRGMLGACEVRICKSNERHVLETGENVEMPVGDAPDANEADTCLVHKMVSLFILRPLGKKSPINSRGFVRHSPR